jgi:hypothetical protein
MFGLRDDSSDQIVVTDDQTNVSSQDPGFSYAAQFNAPSWLETPASYLWGAMQARINGGLTQAVTLLGQFWQALNVVKASATVATWPEILALDSQSQIQSSNITTAIINQVQQDASTTAAWAGIFGWAGADVKTTVANLQAQRAAALQSASDLAAQAGTAQAARVAALAAGQISQDSAQAAIENTTLSKILAPPFSFSDVPTWAWIAGAVGLYLLLGRR